MIGKKTAAMQISGAGLRALSVATFAAALVACGGGSSSGSSSAGSSSTGTYTVLYSFKGSSSDGANPNGLIQGSNGNFYGTTIQGGYGATVGGTQEQYGTLFEITPDGAETILHLFGASSGDGYSPAVGVIQASNGNLYGTTQLGGTNSSCEEGEAGDLGCGTIFEYSPSSGTYTVLYSFGGTGDGADPANLILGSDGNLYGTTIEGGTSTNCSSYGCGTAFEFNLTTDPGTETVLYSFVGGSTDGADPQGGLIQGSDGNFYGTTYEGGANDTGTIYRITPAGSAPASETVLYSFGGPSGGKDGADSINPDTGVIQGSDGNLYGTANLGGANNEGTIFMYSLTSATETVLYSFEGDGSNVVGPNGLIQGSNGNLYGTTGAGGTNCSTSHGCGTLFMFSPGSSTYTVLYNFGNFSTDGEGPGAGVIQTSNGDLYGTTVGGGTSEDGTVFEFAPS